MKDIISDLQDIGLNKMESEVYLLLLKNEPMTAYKIGKLLNKPTANVYKAVDSLNKKGAVVIQSGSKNLCKAIGYDDFLKALQLQFNTKAKNVSRSLSKIKKQRIDEGTYIIKSVDLVIQKARKIIDNSVKIIILDSFSLPFQEIESNIKKAIKRGVTVHILGYSDSIKVVNAHVVISSVGNTIMEKWKSQQLNIVVDGKESIVSLFNSDLSKVHHASWSTNPYLCYTLHTLLMNYNITTRIINAKSSSNKLADIEKVIKDQEHFIESDVSGFHLLMKNHD